MGGFPKVRPARRIGLAKRIVANTSEPEQFSLEFRQNLWNPDRDCRIPGAPTMLDRKNYFVVGLLTWSFIAGTAAAENPERGVNVSIVGSGFVAGESGPTVVNAPLHPETGFEDTFGTGIGLSAEYFRHFSANFRWQVGILYRNWPGERFEGGEFQPGWEFGGAGDFDDLSVVGVYGGISVIRQAGPKLRPFASMDLAVVRMKELDVSVSGASQPYWISTTKDLLTMKGGLSYEISSRSAILFHVGFTILGKPESTSVFSSATAGTAADMGIGFSYTF
jgi:hypothetical protein